MAIRGGNNTNYVLLKYNERSVGSGEGPQDNTTSTTPTTMAPDIYINTAIPQNVDSWYTFKTNNSGVYDVVIFAANYGSIRKPLNFSMICELKNIITQY